VNWEEFSGQIQETTCALGEANVIKREIVLRDVMDGFGLLSVDGKQYSFPSEGIWQSDVAPKVGMLVDVRFNSDGAPEWIQAVSATQSAMHSMATRPGKSLTPVDVSVKQTFSYKSTHTQMQLPSAKRKR
jgi:hypothetical protein